MIYKLEEVLTPRQKREFHDLPKRMYRKNPYWVCPLDHDIENLFDPSVNEMFNGGEAVRWLLRDSRGEVAGRIAAFYNLETAAANEQPTGGCGFFECVDDQNAADMLFEACRQWLRERGMEAMDGPVNFGSRDSWWGLLTEGFELQPLYANPYNPPYYKELFENYGFRNYFNQYTYLRQLRAGIFSDQVYENIKRLENTPGYRFGHIDGKNLNKVADDFCSIYNKAWARFTGVKPMDNEHARKLLKSLKPIIDNRLIYFAYFNDTPVAFFIMVPDINRIIGRFNGKLNLINKIRFMYLLKCTREADRIFGIIFGVTPEFQGKGVESGTIHAFEQYITTRKTKYKTLELAWMGDFNPVMIRFVEKYVCATRLKTHVTYRYLFDREKEFTRCPRLDLKKEQ